MNQWGANGEKQDEERCGHFWELSGQGEQRCFELSIVCLKDNEDSRTGENSSSQCVKEQRQGRELLGHLWAEDDGWD